jgi:rhamnosyltransferase
MKIIAIVVLYNDNTEEAAYNVMMLARQVDKVCLVDNSADACPERFKDIGNAVYLPQYQNKGIAAAQNVGLRYAFEQGADYVLFADPDSTTPEQAVDMLSETYQRLVGQGYNVGGVGSVARNKMTQQMYPLRSNLLRELPELNVKEVTYTMNSISLYPTQLFKDVGLMDESLFIDGVDCEFCWRAATRGFRFLLDNNVVIDHVLGMGTKTIGGKARAMTPPFRMYYQYRNFLWLCRRDYVPRKWLLENGRNYIVKALYYPLMVAPRWRYLKNICRGIAAGVRLQGKNS